MLEILQATIQSFVVSLEFPIELGAIKIEVLPLICLSKVGKLNQIDENKE